MFGLKERVDRLEEMLNGQEAWMARLEAGRPEGLVTCEKCGCAVKQSQALKGKSVIKGLCIVHYIPGLYEERSEHIHTPHYCKACSLRKT